MSRHGYPGPHGHVYAVTQFDPDGAGPAPPQIVMAGQFLMASTIVASNIVMHDPVAGTWSALGAGTNNVVRTLATMANGDLVVGGDFTSAGGQAAPRIARWNGSSWQPLGSFNGTVSALLPLPNGDLIAGGAFVVAGGVTVGGIARWNGSAWSALGAGVSLGPGSPGRVLALARLPNGDVIAAGEFTSAGGIGANNIARWNGASWSALGAGVTGLNSLVTALAVSANGDVVAGGAFVVAGGIAAINIARWDGTAWSPLGTGAGDPGWGEFVAALLPMPNGDLIVGGYFTSAGGVAASTVARWNGASWSAMGAGVPGGMVAALAGLSATSVVAGSVAMGGRPLSAALWNGSTWSAFAPGFNGPVAAFAVRPNGDLVAGGSFTHAGGVVANCIARWDGVSWSPLGGGTDYPVRALASLANGDLVAAGSFGTAGGVMASGIARWDGTSWWPLGSGTNAWVGGLAALPNGGLVAVGGFTLAGGVAAGRVARWDGTSWSPLGAGFADAAVCVVVMPDGSIVVGGAMGAYNNVARWDGTNWSSLGAGTNGTVQALAVLPNGDLVAGGWFTAAGGQSASRIARWNGTTWSPLGAGLDDTVYALAALPNGHLLAGGRFSFTGLPFTLLWRVARWNGSAWSPVGSGLTGSLCEALVATFEGDAFAGGWFDVAGGNLSPFLARLATRCPAAAVAVGAGCSTAAGPMNLTATGLPWIGSTARSTCTGMLANGVGLGLLGLAPVNTPLVALHPAGGAGCTLLASPDLVQVLVGGGVSAAWQFAIPFDLALVGVTLHHQVLQASFNLVGQLTGLHSSNGLALTVGTL
ncbi:MAG: hypothetical protein WBO45_12620 [Planctomycetota bacterium]